MIKDILFIISFSIVFASHFEPLERLKTRLGLNRGSQYNTWLFLADWWIPKNQMLLFNNNL
jgi:hypothetical protein